jgi:hypothetical protein
MATDAVIIDAERTFRAVIRELGFGDEERAVADFRANARAQARAVSISRTVTLLRILKLLDGKGQ